MGSIFGKIDVEVAKFEVLKKNDAFEVRRYLPAVAVRVTTSAAGNNQAFRQLAKYIGVFGNPENRRASETGGEQKVAMTAPVVSSQKVAMTAPVVSSQKVAMTAPVVNSSAGNNADGPQVMQFILPSTFTIDSAPKPISEELELVELSERLFVVAQYSGRTDMADASRRVDKLAAQVAVEEPGLEIDAADWELYRYNPPFTIPAFRTNEIAIRLERMKEFT